MSTRRQFYRRAAAYALGLALGASLGTAIASPAWADSCQLVINPADSPGFYVVAVSCANSTSTSFDLWGEDPGFDEFRQHVFGPSATLSRGPLNEDDIPFNRGDEIYAKVTSVLPNGQLLSDQMTNVIHRQF